MGKLCKRCVAIIRKKSDDEDSEDEERKLDEGGYQRRKSIQIVKEKRVLHTFIAKVLFTKILQQFTTAGYIFFVIFFPNSFKDISTWYMIIPLSCVCFIFTWAHFVKSPPNALISIILLLTSSLSLGYVMGNLYLLFKFYNLYFLSTLSCLCLTNLCLLPFMTVRKMYLDIRRRTYYLIPQLINFLLNVGFVIVSVAVIYTNKSILKTLNMRGRADAVLLLVVPTFFWSACLTLLMTANLKRVVNGDFYFVSRSKDVFLFAALYFF